uniref:Uncharacterized protein n=1 Tax=Fundulus heteroclitus TaxID=8078 RepID=A0A146QYG2_FUNHE
MVEMHSYLIGDFGLEMYSSFRRDRMILSQGSDSMRQTLHWSAPCQDTQRPWFTVVLLTYSAALPLAFAWEERPTVGIRSKFAQTSLFLMEPQRCPTARPKGTPMQQSLSTLRAHLNHKKTPDKGRQWHLGRKP